VNTDGLVLSLASLALLATAFALFAKLVGRVEVGERRWLANCLVAAGMLAAATTLFRGPGISAGSVAGVVLLVGGAYFVLVGLAGQSRQTPNVAVGQPLPAFTAPDATGEIFDLASLEGRPILMKFFRGHW
jgi:hypothetical protein